MQIHGLNKTTLLDYPEHLASTVFTGGCNFRCPFCHNKTLVLNPEEQPLIDEPEVLAYFEKRKTIIEGVCITGGEPTLQKDLPEFLKKIKDIGLKVKLDTNGYRPEIIKSLFEKGLVDYIAMDIKASKENYGKVAGVSNFDVSKIEESIKFIIENFPNYEFRTTVVKELHSPEEILKIKEWLSGTKKYKLQSYKESDGVINPIFTSYTYEEFKALEALLLWS